MKNRKSTPDIMSNLMSNASLFSTEQENVLAVNIESNTAINKKVDELSSLPEVKAVYPANNKAVKTLMPVIEKEKTTFNLSQQVLQDLEDAWIKLRRKLKNEQRITKTLIVEKAIKIILADFESKSELSDIFIELKK